MTFVEVKFECINWWGNEVYRTKNGTPILRLPEDGWFSIADPSDIDGEPCSKLKLKIINIKKLWQVYMKYLMIFFAYLMM